MFSRLPQGVAHLIIRIWRPHGKWENYSFLWGTRLIHMQRKWCNSENVAAGTDRETGADRAAGLVAPLDVGQTFLSAGLWLSMTADKKVCPTLKPNGPTTEIRGRPIPTSALPVESFAVYHFLDQQTKRLAR